MHFAILALSSLVTYQFRELVLCFTRKILGVTSERKLGFCSIASNILNHETKMVTYCITDYKYSLKKILIYKKWILEGYFAKTGDILTDLALYFQIAQSVP
jgi:uncharacterized protein with ParB-like and HNH nuclease domain